MFLWPAVTTDFQNVNAVSILVALGALILGAFVFFRNAPLWLVVAFAVIAGVSLRLLTAAYSGSDVTAATTEALHAVATGLNPYVHYYTSTNPPGQPFPYLPGELALYRIQQILAGSLDDHDRWWSIGALLGIAALAPACGVGRTALAAGLLAVSSTNVLIGVDGSNDTGLLFLLVLAVLALAYAMRGFGGARATMALYAAGAILFGWALAFKALVWIAFPFVLRTVAPERRRFFVLVTVGVAAAFCARYLLWSPVSFFQSIVAGFTSHQNVWGFNVWSALAASHPALMDAVMAATLPVAIFATLFTAMTVWTRRPGTLGEALLQSCIVLATMLLFARWTSLAYYAFLIGVFALSVATFGLGSEPLPAVEKR